jgi:hypothetical protein
MASGHDDDLNATSCRRVGVSASALVEMTVAVRAKKGDCVDVGLRVRDTTGRVVYQSIHRKDDHWIAPLPYASTLIRLRWHRVSRSGALLPGGAYRIGAYVIPDKRDAKGVHPNVPEPSRTAWTRPTSSAVAPVDAKQILAAVALASSSKLSG